jgi:hypothetical protein
VNNKQRLEIHEKVFHKLYTARLSFNHDKVLDILRLVDAWAYAINGNNGEQSQYEIRKAQDYFLSKLNEL